MSTKVTPEDAGCWIAGYWGIYGVSRVVTLAVQHGMPLSSEDEQYVEDYDNGDSVESEVVFDISDEAEAWMNENVAPEGFSFGWHEGEWFLWSEADWQETCD